jgi:predicted O-methyltransferase YrrM
MTTRASGGAARHGTRRTSFAGAWLRTLTGSARALVLSLPSEEARRRVVRIARELGYDHRPGLQTTLPRITVEQIAGDATIHVRSPVPADGNVTLLELVVINALVTRRRPRRLFEIGTFDGRTTLNLAANAADDAIVYTLDLSGSEEPALGVDADDVQFIQRSQEGVRGSRFRRTPEATRIRQLTGDSAAFDYTPYAGAMEFVFVDGSHAYDYVLSDSRAALQLAAPGALIVWHDYGEWPDVTRALHDLAAADRRFARLTHVSGTALALLET